MFSEVASRIPASSSITVSRVPWQRFCHDIAAAHDPDRAVAPNRELDAATDGANRQNLARDVEIHRSRAARFANARAASHPENKYMRRWNRRRTVRDPAGRWPIAPERRSRHRSSSGTALPNTPTRERRSLPDRRAKCYPAARKQAALRRSHRASDRAPGDSAVPRRTQDSTGIERTSWLSKYDRWRTDLKAGNGGGRWCTRLSAERSSRDPARRCSADGQRDPEPFATAPWTDASRPRRFRRLTQKQPAHGSRPRLTFRHGDPHLERAGGAIPLHAPHPGASIRARGRNLRPCSARKNSRRTFFRQPETDRRAVHRIAGFIGHLNRDASRGARSSRVDDSFPFDHLNLKNRRILSEAGKQRERHQK